MKSSFLIKQEGNHIQDAIAVIKNRNIQQFGVLYDQYSPSLYSWILSKTNDVKRSELILERSFLSIWQTIHSYDPDKCKFFIWMLQVTCREMQKPLT